MKSNKFRPDVDAPEWKGGHTPYDIVKEGVIALVVVALLTVLLAVVFGSPDEPALTIKGWSNSDPMDFAATALSELNGTSGTATYGAPYNTAATGQQLGPLTLAKWVGDADPGERGERLRRRSSEVAARTTGPVREPGEVVVASTSRRASWVNSYTHAANHMKIVNGQLVVSARRVRDQCP